MKDKNGCVITCDFCTSFHRKEKEYIGDTRLCIEHDTGRCLITGNFVNLDYGCELFTCICGGKYPG
jgi:hypothetical protein